jgi:hypothetical protein
MDYYSIKAKEKERQVIKKLKNGSYYSTGNGNPNFVEKVTSDAVYVRTKRSKREFRISRSKLREAIRYLLHKRTTTRKELEPYSKYNSSLMGLLRYIFLNEGIVKVAKTAKGLLRLSLKGMRFWFSGCDRSVRDLEIAKDHGAKFILLSYFALQEDTNENWKHHVRRMGYQVLLDSGAFSLFNAALKGKEVEPITISDYIAFIRRHRDVLYAWMNLDVIGDYKASQRNLEALKAEGLTPIPVWTAKEDGFAELGQIIHDEAEYPVVAIGGTVFLSETKRKEIFDQIFSRFPQINFHGLGVSSQLLFSYPWFSSDSTSWLNGRRYGTIITPKGHIDVPEGWTEDECLAWNVEQLSRMEEQYEGEFQMDLLIPPVLKHKELALF